MDEPPLTETESLNGKQIRSMIKFYKSRETDAIEKKRELDNRIEDNEAKYTRLSESLANAKKKFEVSCVYERNNYSREAIREDYALGLKEYITFLPLRQD